MGSERMSRRAGRTAAGLKMTKARLVVLTCLAALCGACEPAVDNASADGAVAASAPPEIEHIGMLGMEGLDLPFSAAVRVGHTIYLSGMIGNVPGKLELVPGGIREQTRQALENVREVLERAGSSMDRVVKCTVFLADMSEWTAMNEVYATFFETPPARSAFGGNELALDGKVEIECIAIATS